MKKIILILTASYLACTGICAENKETIDMDLLSESLGHLLIRHFATPEGYDLSISKIQKGMKDELKSKPAPLSEEQYEQMMSLLQEKLFQEKSLKNLNAAETFLTNNIKREEVIAINENLQYQVIEEGDGKVVLADTTPLVHFKGNLLDGSSFCDSGWEEPIAMPLAQTIAGFAQGIAGMKEGETRKLFIHPELAFGTEGHFPPNSLLVFEVKVISATDQRDLESIEMVDLDEDDELDEDVELDEDDELVEIDEEPMELEEIDIEETEQE